MGDGINLTEPFVNDTKDQYLKHSGTLFFKALWKNHHKASQDKRECKSFHSGAQKWYLIFLSGRLMEVHKKKLTKNVMQITMYYLLV